MIREWLLIDQDSSSGNSCLIPHQIFSFSTVYSPKLSSRGRKCSLEKSQTNLELSDFTEAWLRNVVEKVKTTNTITRESERISKFPEKTHSKVSHHPLSWNVTKTRKAWTQGTPGSIWFLATQPNWQHEMKKNNQDNGEHRKIKTLYFAQRQKKHRLTPH